MRRQFGRSVTKSLCIRTLHFDTKGKVETEYIHGYSYFLTITEEQTRFVAVRSLKWKADAAESIIRFVKYFERQTGYNVKNIHRDDGSSFLRALSTLEELGVKISITTPYTPGPNGLVERTQQTILFNACTCLRQFSHPDLYWSYAVRHFFDCFSIEPSKNKQTSPYQELFGFA